MEEEGEEHQDTSLTSTSDLCQQLMDRYSGSSATQHRHLLATAAAMRSILSAESLPLTPAAYFAASISAISNPSETLEDSEAVAALTSFLAMVLPLVPSLAISPGKAAEAVEVLVGLLRRGSNVVSAPSIRAVVKSLGVLTGFCDLEDWGSVKLGFETLLKFSVDKRPKVRKCAQVCVEKVFQSYQSSTIIKKASKSVLVLLKSYMPLAVELSTSKTADGYRDGILSKPDHLEVLHMLNVLRLIVPFLSVKVGSKILSELQKLMTSQFSALTRHILKIIEAFFEASRVKVSIPEMENILISLASYISLEEKNPMDTVISAATLLKNVLDKLHVGESGLCIGKFPLVIGPLAGLLTSEASTVSQASNILKELINHHINQKIFLSYENQPFEDEARWSVEAIATKSTCDVFDNLLSTCDGIPNEHVLGVISVLFLKLGEISFSFMRGIVLKLANLMTLAGGDMCNTTHLQTCIGSAVIALGPERMLKLLPISLHANFTSSNIWLIPIMKNYVVGASLKYYMEHIVPLAESFQQACLKVEKSVIDQDLQAHAHGLWGLLPAFCRHPTDTCENFGLLVELLITLIKDGSFMHENIALALQELVNQNRRVLSSKRNADESNTYGDKDYIIKFRNVPSYSKKTATKNLKALASYSTELLQALTDLFFVSSSEKRSYLKDAIGCLASISDSSVIKKIFLSSLVKFQFINDMGEFEKPGNDKEQGSTSSKEKDAQRCLIIELASSFIEGAQEDLIDLIYNLIRHTFQATDEIGHREAYQTLSRILEEHAWFCSSRLLELIDLLLDMKSPVDTATLRSRFASFHIIIVHIVKGNLEEDDTKAFLILNEIILTLKDSSEEGRKVAHDMLLLISSSLRNLPSVSLEVPYQKLITMISGYLSGPSPHIKSGAVSALSILVYKDVDIILAMPDLLPSVLSQLGNKSVEVTKAVLGFVKVLVSCLQVKDLQNLLPDIVNSILPSSSSSRHHFRSKITVILEILIRKCGSASVEFVTPEKYKNFLKTVLENRHGKASFKEVDATNTEPTSKDLSSHGEDDSLESRKRKREKGQNPRTNEPNNKARRFNDAKSTKSWSPGSREKRRKDFKKDVTSDGKRWMKGGKVRENGKAEGHKAGYGSKLHKLKKDGGWKRQKTNK